MRSLVLGLVSMMTLACSQLLPVPDPVPLENDAGPGACTTTEALAGRCVEGLGEGVECPTTPFSIDHAWANETTTLRFVEPGGTGDGQSASAAAGSIAEALSGVTDAVTILVGAGTFEPPTQLPLKRRSLAAARRSPCSASTHKTESLVLKTNRFDSGDSTSMPPH